MRDEKLMILTMLEEGKITSQEAIKLLEALEETESFIEYEPYEEDEKRSIDLEKTKENLEALERKIEEKGNKIVNVGTDLGSKLSNVLSSLFNAGNSLNMTGNYRVIDTQLEKDISHLDKASLDIKSINGRINLRVWGEEKLLIKIVYRYKNNGFTEDNKFYNLYEKGNRVIFEPIYTNNVMMDLDIYLPHKDYEEVSLTTTNGKIQVKDLRLNQLLCKTTNGRINLEDISSPILSAASTNGSIKFEDIHSRDLKVSTNNGRITLSNISGEGITAKTSNGTIEINSLSGKVVKVNTSNGKIICRNLDKEKIGELKLSTSNSTIDVEIGNRKKSYYHLETSFGNIHLAIPDLVYKVNKQINLGVKKIIAHSADFNENEDHFILHATTSNGSIKIR